FEHLRRVTHPRRQRRRVIDHHIPLPVLQRVEIAVTIADELLDFSRQFAGMRLPTVESGHLVPATERILNLIWTSESAASENQNRFRCLLCKQRRQCCARHNHSRGGYFDETTAIH